MTIILSIMGSEFLAKSVFDKAGGYSLIWFIYLYLLAAYIRLHYNEDKNRIPGIGNVRHFKFFMVLIYLFILICQLVILFLYNKVRASNFIFLEYNNPLILCSSLALFLLFRNITIKGEIINKIILKISPLTLAVYLIHQHPKFSPVLWDKLLHPVDYISTPKIFIVLLIDVALIFTISCCIEKMRKVIFGILGKLNCFDRISQRLEKYRFRIGSDDI